MIPWPKDPQEIKQYDNDELQKLAQQTRDFIIQVVSQNGGHLASSLGTVELTLALLKVFDFSYGKDQIVWDVGHQSYAWKILTGRADRFPTLRQMDGLAGFPKREESDYDFFNTGHSSTSISAAQGLARAKELKGEEGRVIAVIGDGAMTGGLAYEAMNNLVQSGENVIVILNDNQMSIDVNVGSLVKHLEKLRVHPSYLDLKEDTLEHLKHIPWLGERIKDHLDRLKYLMRTRLHRSGSIFENLGFRYYGPVDGHNIEDLELYLQGVRKIKQPVLIHVVTQKGKGYDFAEGEPSLYHGVAPFVEEKGVPKPVPNRVNDLNKEDYFSRDLSFTQGFTWAIHRLAEKHPELVAVCAAMSSGTGLTDFSIAWPERFFDVGIAEQHAVTLAAGMAAGGMKPIVALYATFLQRALDQVYHDVSLQRLPVFFAIDRAGLVGEDGETHQGIYDLNFLKGLPKLEIWTASDPLRLATRMTQLYESMDETTMLRYARGRAQLPRELWQKLDDPLPTREDTYRSFDFGAAIDETKTRLVACSYGQYTGDLARICQQMVDDTPGLRIQLLDFEQIKPVKLDKLEVFLLSADGILIAEENSGPGPLADAILPWLYYKGAKMPVLSRHLPRCPIHQGTRAEQLERYGLGNAFILRALRALYEGANL